MQKGEYLSVTAYGGKDGEWRPKYVNESEKPAWDTGPTLHAYLLQLGDEGWELVSEHLDLNPSRTTWKTLLPRCWLCDPVALRSRWTISGPATHRCLT